MRGVRLASSESESAPGQAVLTGEGLLSQAIALGFVEGEPGQATDVAGDTTGFIGMTTGFGGDRTGRDCAVFGFDGVSDIFGTVGILVGISTGFGGDAAVPGC
jgi:hypothetical protein